MIHREGNTIVVQGAVTVYNVVDLTQQGLALLNNNHLQVDLQQVTEVDSTIISMLFEWLRAANQKNCRLKFIHLPASLESLMQLYGVTEIIAPVHSSDN